MENSKKWYQSSIVIFAILLAFFPLGLFLMWKYAGWNKVIKIIITGFFGLILLVSMFSSNTGNSQTQSITSPTPQAQAVENKPQFTFDIPALVGKNIDEIRNILGESIDGDAKEPTSQQISLGTKHWDNTFKKDNKELLVTYDVKTRKVVDFFIGTDDPSGATKDTRSLLETGNLTTNATQYKIENVKTIKDPSIYTGIKIIPQ